MKRIYYVGFYSGKKCKYRPNCEENIAASMKMDFIKDSLKKLGYKVILLSISMDYTIKKADLEKYIIDECEEHIYLPYYQIKLAGKYRAGMHSAIKNLYRYGVRNFREGDIVIAYHSLAYGNILHKLQKRKKIKLINQIEEIYCLSNFEGKGNKYLDKEISIFSGADGYLMINENVANKYSEGKPYAVSYGNYKVFCERDIVINNENVGIVYSGIINDDRGAFKIIEAMEYLPIQYNLHILGFGTENNMKKMKNLIDNVNSSSTRKRVFFHGTKTGSDYSEFLSEYEVGISLMDTSDEVGLNAFPSKIMTYLGHSLLVVSSKSQCVTDSKISDAIYFCDNEPKQIAETIKSIPKGVHESPAFKLRELELEFLNDLSNVLINV